MAFLEFLGALLCLCFIIYSYFIWNYSTWRKKKVPFIEPKIPFGNVENPFKIKKGFNFIVRDFYNYFRSRGNKYGGVYVLAKPALIPVDVELIKNILVKDFAYFSGHGLLFNEDVDPMSANIFNFDGQKWKDLRMNITPTFTSGKMKAMFPILNDIRLQMEEHMKRLWNMAAPVQITEVFACYTTDVIGSCAFGVECNSFNYPDAEFRTHFRRAMTPSFGTSLNRTILSSMPTLHKLLKVQRFDVDITRFFINSIKTISDHRKETGFRRNDFIQLLLDLQNQLGEEHFTLKQIAAQAFFFFLGGFETSSTTATCCLAELAHNQDIQDRVRDEIHFVIQKYDGQLTYESLAELKYLHQVINETLRKYPVFVTILRECTKNYTIREDNVVIEAGTRVFISVLGLHHNEEYFPNPDHFDPERFNEENVSKLVPFSYLPFGEGPRICLGQRFGMMQLKVGLCALLRNYKFFPCDETVFPIQFSKKATLLSCEKPMFLKVLRV